MVFCCCRRSVGDELSWEHPVRLPAECPSCSGRGGPAVDEPKRSSGMLEGAGAGSADEKACVVRNVRVAGYRHPRIAPDGLEAARAAAGVRLVRVAATRRLVALQDRAARLVGVRLCLRACWRWARRRRRGAAAAQLRPLRLSAAGAHTTLEHEGVAAAVVPHRAQRAHREPIVLAEPVVAGRFRCGGACPAAALRGAAAPPRRRGCRVAAQEDHRAVRLHRQRCALAARPRRRKLVGGADDDAPAGDQGNEHRSDGHRSMHGQHRSALPQQRRTVCAKFHAAGPPRYP